MSYTIDTLTAARELEDAGIEPGHARAIVTTIARADDSLATKTDLDAVRTGLEAAMETLKAELTVRIIASQIATAMLLFAALRFLG